MTPGTITFVERNDYRAALEWLHANKHDLDALKDAPDFVQRHAGKHLDQYARELAERQ